MQHCQVTRRAGIKIKGRTVRQQLQKHDFPIRAVAVSRMKEGGGAWTRELVTLAGFMWLKTGPMLQRQPWEERLPLEGQHSRPSRDDLLAPPLTHAAARSQARDLQKPIHQTDIF